MDIATKYITIMSLALDLALLNSTRIKHFNMNFMCSGCVSRFPVKFPLLPLGRSSYLRSRAVDLLGLTVGPSFSCSCEFILHPLHLLASLFS